MASTIKIILLGLLLFSFTFFAYCFYRVYKKVYRHIPADRGHPDDYKLTFEGVEFQSKDGTELVGWFFPVKNPKATIILVHGYGEPRGGKVHHLEHAKYLTEDNFAVLVFDLRGFSESNGDKITLGFKESEDVLAAVNFLKGRKDTENLKIGILGTSMGGASSIIATAKTDKIDVLITNGAFKSIEDLLREQVEREKFPIFPTLTLLELSTKLLIHKNLADFSAENWIGKIKNTPILIIHGEDDKTVDVSQAKELYRRAKEPKKLWIVPRASHEVFSERKEDFKEQVLSFFNRYLR
jgi:fermentation-respiration switch protein FrsA (DUF1100 family)